MWSIQNPVINRKFQSDMATLGVYGIAHFRITPVVSFPWSLLLWQRSIKPCYLVFLFRTSSTLCSCFNHIIPFPPRVSHYFWNVIAIACSYISNLGLEPACHVVWNNAFSFFKAKKKWNSLDLFVFFVHLFTCFTSASDVRLMEFMEVTPETLDQRCRYPESNDLGEILYGVDDVCHSNEASLDFTLWKNMS